jgi:hypothetical protein
MDQRHFQFSLRTSLIMTTVMAGITAVVAIFPSVILGLAIWLLGIGFLAGCYFAPFKEDLAGSETREQRRERLSNISKG